MSGVFLYIMISPETIVCGKDRDDQSRYGLILFLSD